jgi:hypothetical protein
MRLQMQYRYRYTVSSSLNAPDIRPGNPAFFDIRYPAGYRISMPDIQ